MTVLFPQEYLPQITPPSMTTLLPARLAVEVGVHIRPPWYCTLLPDMSTETAFALSVTITSMSLLGFHSAGGAFPHAHWCVGAAGDAGQPAFSETLLPVMMS